MLGALRTLFLLLTFVLGQSHFCPSEYVLPSGRVCPTCPTIADAQRLRAASHQNLLQAIHGDCHDCCTLHACDDDPESLKADLSPAPVYSAILPTQIAVVPVGLAEIRTETPAAVELYLPCGPPSDRSSRAPPVPFV